MYSILKWAKLEGKGGSLYIKFRSLGNNDMEQVASIELHIAYPHTDKPTSNRIF
jgi:hypothetical protein